MECEWIHFFTKSDSAPFLLQLSCPCRQGTSGGKFAGRMEEERRRRRVRALRSMVAEPPDPH
eukprot:1158323-Pelagomonas_calceolata.AAC.4